MAASEYKYINIESNMAVDVSQICNMMMNMNTTMGKNHFFLKVDLVVNSKVSASASSNTKTIRLDTATNCLSLGIFG